MQPSRTSFLTLPLELRQSVYDLFLDRDRGNDNTKRIRSIPIMVIPGPRIVNSMAGVEQIIPRKCNPSLQDRHGNEVFVPISLLQTCQQVHLEVTDWVYRKFIICFSDTAFSVIVNWLASVGERNRSLIRAMHFDFSCPDPTFQSAYYRLRLPNTYCISRDHFAPRMFLVPGVNHSRAHLRAVARSCGVQSLTITFRSFGNEHTTGTSQEFTQEHQACQIRDMLRKMFRPGSRFTELLECFLCLEDIEVVDDQGRSLEDYKALEKKRTHILRFW